MKKLFSIFAAVLFAGSMMAGDSFTITFKDSGSGSDSSTGLTSTTISDYIASGDAYVSGIEASGKVYNAQSGYGLKFGNSSNPGSITLTLANAVKPTTIVMSASQYGASEGSGLLQDSVFDMTGGGGKGTFKDYTYVYDGKTEVTTIVLGTKTKRGYVKSLTVNFEEEGGEEETGCAWDELEWLGGPAEYAEQFKVCVGDPAPASVVNIQQPGFAAELGIYMSFPAAPITSVSLEEGQYAIDGAGIVLYVSALTQKENEITVVANEVEYEFTVYNDKGEEAPVEINITSGVVYNEYYDMLWQVIAANDIYTIGLAGFLNEGGTAAGTYELGDLYTEACGMYYGSSELEITAAHITVVVGEDGSITVDGTIVAGGETYSIHFEYTVPTAETTVELTVAEAELDTEYLVDEDDPEFGVMGKDESGVYVQLYIYNDEVEGEYTEEDLDTEYSAIWLTDEDAVSIYSADVKITREGNVYTVKADLLCYNNTLYKVTMTFEVEDDPTGVDNAAVAAKILKAIENGNVVIKKGNTKFNVGGQVIR